MRVLTSIEVKIQEETFGMIRFADDIAIVAETEADLKHFMQRIEEIVENEYNLIINKGKTKLMVVGKDGNSTVHLEMNEENLEDVNNLYTLEVELQRW